MTDRSEEPAKRKLAVPRIIWGCASVAVAAVSTWLYGGLLTNEPSLIGVVASIFSILAGVLIAVISILGDPSMLLDQSWRHSYLSAGEMQRSIYRQTDVFLMYIILLLALFAFMICPADAVIYPYLQHSTFFLTVLAFCISLGLPFTLRGIQRARLERAIAHLKKNS